MPMYKHSLLCAEGPAHQRSPHEALTPLCILSWDHTYFLLWGFGCRFAAAALRLLAEKRYWANASAL